MSKAEYMIIIVLQVFCIFNVKSLQVIFTESFAAVEYENRVSFTKTVGSVHSPAAS